MPIARRTEVTPRENVGTPGNAFAPGSSVRFGIAVGAERSARSGCIGRPISPRPSISSSPGTRSPALPPSAGGISRPSGLGSSSTARISLPDTPSTTEWWTLVSSATRPPCRPWIRYSSHSGRVRSSGRAKIRATVSASWRSSPGGGTAESRMWKSRSKSGSSIQYGWSSPSGTSTSRQRNGGSMWMRSLTRRQMSAISSRPPGAVSGS